jgi:hypothetical protein
MRFTMAPPSGSGANLENRRVRSARHVTAILRVPIGQQHDEDFQTVQFPGADEGIVVPRPAMLFEQLLDGRIVELEARGDEPAACGVDARACTLEAGGTLDGTRRNEVGDL